MSYLFEMTYPCSSTFQPHLWISRHSLNKIFQTCLLTTLWCVPFLKNSCFANRLCKRNFYSSNDPLKTPASFAATSNSSSFLIMSAMFCAYRRILIKDCFGRKSNQKQVGNGHRSLEITSPCIGSHRPSAFNKAK